jgi:hypothetical protein
MSRGDFPGFLAKTYGATDLMKALEQALATASTSG